MTSSEPLVDLVLRTLREAEPGSYMQPHGAAKFDLEHARNLDGAGRLAAFDQVQMLAEAFGLPEPSREPIRHGDLKL